MKKIIVYKNIRGYGPKTRTDVSVGDELEIVSDDGVVDTHVRVLQVTEDQACDRCSLCSMSTIVDGGADALCLCNSFSMPNYSVPICTIRCESMDGVPGIYAVLNKPGDILEDL